MLDNWCYCGVRVASTHLRGESPGHVILFALRLTLVKVSAHFGVSTE